MKKNNMYYGSSLHLDSELEQKIDLFNSFGFEHVYKKNLIAHCVTENGLPVLLLVITIIISVIIGFSVEKTDYTNSFAWGTSIMTFFIIYLMSLLLIMPLMARFGASKKLVQKKALKIMSDSISAFVNIENIIELHIKILVRKKRQLVLTDDYGISDDSKYLQELDYFYDNIISPQISDNTISIVKSLYKINNPTKFKEANDEDIYNSIYLWVMRQVDECVETSEIEFNYSENMDGYEFEEFCGEILKKHGWQVKQTPKSGDQGADVLVEKDGSRVVIQCKKYSSPVGNKAVQEVFAAQKFFDTDHAAVVTNNTYTRSAKSLANTNNVLLLHYEQLEELENLIT